MANTMKYRKKSKTLAMKPKLPSSETWSPETDARLQEFMGHAIGRHVDAYLKNLAMTVVHLKAMSEIAALQSNLLKEKAEIAQERRQLILEKEGIVGVLSSPLHFEKMVEKVKSSVPDETMKIKEPVSRTVVKKTLFSSGRRRG